MFSLAGIKHNLIRKQRHEGPVHRYKCHHSRVVHTVTDSSGNIINDLKITPSSGTSRTLTDSATSTASGNAPASYSGGLSSGATAGVNVGAGLGGLLLIGGPILLFLHRRQKKRKRLSQPYPEADLIVPGQLKPELSDDPVPRKEMSGSPVEQVKIEPQELPVPWPRYEMEADSRGFAHRSVPE
ncbi:uncharacterized protein BDZ99DRAFT_100672 [Mytilinidion resinicola]|uniref:Mid2 domain-containing protein n=1 Tax=Mytilinidion resinicola TaxID=574789 RepID=A0A6A6YCY7_9PEZI|nr:uncharacterized protein BDZ99DRAFT_100672 [Mytilinidion resinicola]KAF2805955.1 hypothetical protein BDZ99DRAFT_100672 [Mytilinidion resinicola]